MILRKFFYIICFSALAGCDNEPVPEDSGNTSMIALQIRTSAAVNTDVQTWEDRVDEIRMIVFNTAGRAVYNSKLRFPNGFDNPCAPIKLVPGKYDFHFIANETAGTADFASALDGITHDGELSQIPQLGSQPYNPSFNPDGTTPEGRFIMSARYDDINVGKGGTEENPLPLQLPTGRVELIRALAKVEVIFRKKIPGGIVPEGSISSVWLENVAANYSVPAIDAYYTGSRTVSPTVTPADFDYGKDSIGSVIYYIPEFLFPADGSNFTEIHINDRIFPILTDEGMKGLAEQRRTVPSLSPHSVIRNYHYRVNAYLSGQGDIQLETSVVPWTNDEYKYMFQDDGGMIVTPPVAPTDSSLIVPTDCGKIEILSHNEVLPQGLMGANGDKIVWWDPVLGGPAVVKGKPPYYCEQKYGPGWRMINSCELMSLLTLFDRSYRIWQSNTWQGVNSGLKFYSLPFRQEAQALLEKLTGQDMSRFTLTDNGRDNFGGEKLDMLDQYFTPGDILITEKDYPTGWPYYGRPNNNGQTWYPMEVVIQIKGYWYSGYLDLSNNVNYNKVLYGEFQRFDYSSTVSRCVRSVE